jgi:hypothetical protein
MTLVVLTLEPLYKGCPQDVTYSEISHCTRLTVCMHAAVCPDSTLSMCISNQNSILSLEGVHFNEGGKGANFRKPPVFPCSPQLSMSEDHFEQLRGDAYDLGTVTEDCELEGQDHHRVTLPQYEEVYLSLSFSVEFRMNKHFEDLKINDLKF